MRKIYKIIGGMLSAGVLIAGIGSGVAFAEYSSFDYGGEVILEGSQRFTKTVEYKVTAKNGDISEMGDTEKDRTTEAVAETEDVTGEMNVTPEAEEEAVETDSSEEKVLNIYIGGHCTIVEDATVPKDVVRFAITYLSDNENICPSVDCAIVKNEGKIYENLYVDTDFYYNDYNDFRNIMRVKDLILSDLKNHRIGDYQLDGVEQRQIYVNPDADFDINIEW